MSGYLIGLGSKSPGILRIIENNVKKLKRDGVVEFHDPIGFADFMEFLTFMDCKVEVYDGVGPHGSHFDKIKQEMKPIYYRKITLVDGPSTSRVMVGKVIKKKGNGSINDYAFERDGKEIFTPGVFQAIDTFLVGYGDKDLIENNVVELIIQRKDEQR